MVLVDVVQNLFILGTGRNYLHLVIQRYEVLNLGLRDSTLRGGDVSQSVTDLVREQLTLH